MIEVDKNFFEATIDTEQWLDKVTAREVSDEIFDGYDFAARHGEDENDWPFWGNEYDADRLAGIVRERFPELGDVESVARDNSYNAENDFSKDFVFEIFADTSRTGDWLYTECLVAINLHRGGDPRGNYDSAQFFIVECPAESGFLDWIVDLFISYANGESADDQGRYTSGYTSAPIYNFESDAKVIGYSEKRECWLAWFEGRAVEISFNARAEYI